MGASMKQSIESAALEMIRMHREQPRELITPGMPFGPTFIPYCAYCNSTVGRYVIEMPRDPYRIGVDAKCCGVHQGAYVTIDELTRVLRGGHRFYLVVRPGQYQKCVGENRRADVPE
jgi:hypothetical protein